MTGTIKKFLLGATVIAGVSAIAIAPASATTFTISGTDFIKYQAIDTNSDGIPDTTMAMPSANLNTILQGNCPVVAGACTPPGSPGGNVELGSSIDTNPLYLNLNNFKTAPVTSLLGTFGDGTQITLSSLNGTDWFGLEGGGYSTIYGQNNLANKWFSDALASNGGALQSAVNSLLGGNNATAYNMFLGAGGFQRFSDPNPSYVNKGADGSVKIGLAGHYNAGDVFTNPLLKSVFNNLQISELIKSNYAGKTQYKYSFSAAKSGLKEKVDGKSHNGNYEVDPLPEKVPEPSAVLGLVAVGGLFVASRKLRKS